MRIDRKILASRLREIRIEKFGVNGVATVAGYLGIPERTWDHYEGGVVVPACVLLEFIVLTGVDPRWLMMGEGYRCLARSFGSDQSASLRFSK